MADHSERMGIAIEAHYQFVPTLLPAVGNAAEAQVRTLAASDVPEASDLMVAIGGKADESPIDQTGRD
jgi:hypothetical protein